MLGTHVSLEGSYTLISDGEILTKDTSLCVPDRCVLFYFDKRICTTCVTKYAYKWDRYVRDSLGIKDIVPLFIFAPVGDVYSLIAETRIYDSLSFYVDNEDRFLKRNRFIPQEEAFHTMLIGDDLTILAIGNPVGNSELTKLFISRID